MKKENEYFIKGVFVGMLLFIGYTMTTMFHDPQEAVSFFQGQLEGKKNYWIQPSAGGGPHIRCESLNYSNGIAVCETNSVWRFDYVGINFNWNNISPTDANIQQCRMAYDLFDSFCEGVDWK